MEGGGRQGGFAEGQRERSKPRRWGGWSASGQGLQVQRTEAQGRDPHSSEGSWRQSGMAGVLCGILDAMGVVKRERGGLEKRERGLLKSSQCITQNVRVYSLILGFAGTENPEQKCHRLSCLITCCLLTPPLQGTCLNLPLGPQGT